MTAVVSDRLPAKLQETAGVTWWVCPSCNVALGQVFPSHVLIVMRRRRIIIPRDAAVEQYCGRCGARSTLTVSADGVGVGVDIQRKGQA